MDKQSHREDERPWERLGVLRRDCLPHRGGLLCALSGASVALAMFIGPLGLAMGLVIWMEARHDVAQMRLGLMDARGEAKTVDARDCAVMSIGFALFSTAFWTWLLLTQPGSCKFMLYF